MTATTELTAVEAPLIKTDRLGRNHFTTLSPVTSGEATASKWMKHLSIIRQDREKGVNWDLWVYKSDTGEVLDDWHVSRANDCLENILNAPDGNFSGLRQCDGHKAYQTWAFEKIISMTNQDDMRELLPAAWVKRIKEQESVTAAA